MKDQNKTGSWKSRMCDSALDSGELRQVPAAGS